MEESEVGIRAYLHVINLQLPHVFPSIESKYTYRDIEIGQIVILSQTRFYIEFCNFENKPISLKVCRVGCV